MCPLLVLWGERGTVGRLEPRDGPVAGEGRQRDRDVAAAGHFLPEEVPDETLSAVRAFLR
jgi:pimeloyl-ACP methyl ester carboxylesterase